jgi:NaMN:DMB phosphoribosyltransferase
VVREGVGAGGEMTQVLYAHMNNKKIKIKKKYLYEFNAIGEFYFCDFF